MTFREIRDYLGDFEFPTSREFDEHKYLADFLGQTFLVEKPKLQQIPYIIEEIFAPLLNDEYIARDERTGRLRAELVSSVPKCMAGNVDERFCRYPIFFGQQAEQLLGKKREEEAYEILEYLSLGPDLDIKLEFLPQKSYQAFGSLLADSLIERYVGEDDKYEVAVENGVVVYSGFQIKGFEVELNFGPIPSNPKKQRAELKFFDQQDPGKVAFLCHITDLPTEARDALADKRLETNDKQDLVFAYLEYDDGGLTYRLDEKAEEVMARIDSLVDLKILKEKTASELAEIAIRALRMNMLHSFMEYDEDTVGVDKFFPLIKSASIFDLRHAIFPLVLIREQGIPDSVRFIVARELFLCLTINPYLTTLFLRDSGLGLLIPGLVDLSLEDWDNLLNSFKLAVAVDRQGHRVVLPGRGYLAAQIEEYCKDGRMDGAELFVSALEEVRMAKDGQLLAEEGISCWTKLLGLFKERGEVDENREELMEEIIGRKGEAEFSFADGVMPFAGEGYVVGVVDDGSGRIFTLIGTDSVDADSRQSFLKNMRRAFRRKDSLVKEKEGIEPNFAFIKKMIGNILDFPGGLTARELSVLTTGERTGQQFAEQFLLLKMAGVILRYPVYRYDRKGDLVRTDFYGLRRNFRQINLLAQLAEPGSQRGRRFKTEFKKLTGRDNGFRYIRALVRKKDILTIEALQSLTEEDFELMDHIPYMGSDVESCYTIVSAIIEAFRRIEAEKF